jgi:hypothetical protein
VNGAVTRLIAVAACTAMPVTASAQATLVSAQAATQLKPGKWVYVTRLLAGSSTTRLGFRTLELASSTYGGAPAWLLVDSRQINTITLAESLYVAKADLAPKHRASHSADVDVQADYTKDSIVTTFAGAQSGRVAVQNDPGVVGSLYWLEPLMQVVPLADGWHAQIPFVVVSPTDHGRVVADLRVVGSEKALVPDGEFDCWIVALTVGHSEQRLWVRKSDRLMIKQDVPVQDMAAAKVQLLLAEKGVH